MRHKFNPERRTSYCKNCEGCSYCKPVTRSGERMGTVHNSGPRESGQRVAPSPTNKGARGSAKSGVRERNNSPCGLAKHAYGYSNDEDMWERRNDNDEVHRIGRRPLLFCDHTTGRNKGKSPRKSSLPRSRSVGSGTTEKRKRMGGPGGSNRVRKIGQGNPSDRLPTNNGRSVRTLWFSNMDRGGRTCRVFGPGQHDCSVQRNDDVWVERLQETQFFL